MCPNCKFFRFVFSRIWNEYGVSQSESVQMRKNAEQKNSKYGHFLHGAYFQLRPLSELLTNFRHTVSMILIYVERKSWFVNEVVTSLNIKHLDNSNNHWPMAFHFHSTYLCKNLSSVLKSKTPLWNFKAWLFILSCH